MHLTTTWGYLIAATFFVPSAVAAQPPVPRSVCEPYEPSAQEIAEVLKAATPAIPETARLYAACVVPMAVNIAPLEFADRHSFRFEWPSGQSYGGIELLRRAGCSRTFAAVRCSVSTDLAIRRSAEEAITLHRASDARELFDLLAFRDRVLRADYRIIEISGTPRVESDSGAGKVTEYTLRGEYGSGEKAAFRVEHSCDLYSRCTWKLGGPFRWQQ